MLSVLKDQASRIVALKGRGLDNRHHSHRGRGNRQYSSHVLANDLLRNARRSAAFACILMVDNGKVLHCASKYGMPQLSVGTLTIDKSPTYLQKCFATRRLKVTIIENALPLF